MYNFKITIIESRKDKIITYTFLNRAPYTTPSHLGFRSYQLKPVDGKIGRPKEKRRYTRHTISITKLPATSPDSLQGLSFHGHEQLLRPVNFNAILDNITMANSLTEVCRE